MVAELFPKTVVDALDPAIKVLKESAEGGGESLIEVLEKAVREGMQKTIPLIAKRGRACSP